MEGQGIERSEWLVAEARAARLDVRQGPPCQAISGSLPVITAWEVLEHVPCPRVLAGILASHLSTGGILAVSTPNGGGFLSRMMGPRFPFAIAPEHVTLFSIRALRRLLKEAGLEVIRLKTYSG